jgi:long-chain acyl-CoA synthetase
MSQQEQQQQHQWSIVVPNTARKGIRGNIHRWVDGTVGHDKAEQDKSNKVSYGPYLSLYGCRTLYETIRYGESINPLGPCLGYRAVSSNTGYSTPYIYISYTETLSRINCIAAGLYTMKLLQRNSDNMLLLGLYVKNCVEWVLGEHAIYTLGGATVPLYDTLGSDVVQYILNHTDLTAVLCSQCEVQSLCDAKQSGKCNKFQYIIVIDGVTDNLLQLAKSVNVTILSLAKVETMGSKFISSNGGPYKACTLYHNPPSSKDICTICYTSGTTGVPKGAILIHENLISAGSGTIVGTPLLEFSITDRHLSYLPLPHIFERMVQTTVLASGASIAFYCGNPLQLFDDIITCQPTLLPIVPRVCNKIYDKVCVCLL